MTAEQEREATLERGWLRYEKLRKLNPRQFADLHARNLAGEVFDDMVDALPKPSTPMPARTHQDAAPEGWQPIETAPKDHPIITNDTTHEGSAVAVAIWIDHPEWHGWAYEDEYLRDAEPEGPMPTYWLDVPPPPAALSEGGVA